MVVIGLIGTPCSGKASFADMLNRRFNYKVLDLKNQELDIKQL
jgi:dephospho-CoA kinase